MPNSNPPISPRLEDIGLEPYLNSTRSEHNDNGFNDFVKRVQLQEPKTVIARAFHVHSSTIRDWIRLHDKELKRTEKEKHKK